MISARAETPVAVLAAGQGRRLWGERLPKPCVPLLDSSIAAWNLRAFVDAGLCRFLVVLGDSALRARHHYEAVAAALSCSIEFVVAAEWRRGNGVSALAAARHLAGRPFLLSMADHLFSSDLIEDFVSRPPVEGSVHLAVDRDIGPEVDLEDLTKVQLVDGLVVDIGKDLASWNAGDVGLFHCTGALAEALERAQAAGGYALTDGARECVRRRELRALEIGVDHAWLDIDTPLDLERAERMLRER